MLQCAHENWLSFHACLQSCQFNFPLSGDYHLISLGAYLELCLGSACWSTAGLRPGQARRVILVVGIMCLIGANPYLKYVHLQWQSAHMHGAPAQALHGFSKLWKNTPEIQRVNTKKECLCLLQKLAMYHILATLLHHVLLTSLPNKTAGLQSR